MDLLHNTYSNNSDDDDEENDKKTTLIKRSNSNPPPLKRPKQCNYTPSFNPLGPGPQSKGPCVGNGDDDNNHQIIPLTFNPPPPRWPEQHHHPPSFNPLGPGPGPNTGGPRDGNQYSGKYVPSFDPPPPPERPEPYYSPTYFNPLGPGPGPLSGRYVATFDPSPLPEPYYYPTSSNPLGPGPGSSLGPQSGGLCVGSGSSVSGRYVSKRERALMGNGSSSGQFDCSTTPSLLPSTNEIGSISSAFVRQDILLSLKKRGNTFRDKNKLPDKVCVDLSGHLKPVNAVEWSTSHAHLLASAGMDNCVYIWNVWSEQQKKARVFSYHHAAVKDVRWSPQGHFILSCGYDCVSKLVDVEKGSEIQTFADNQAITATRFHPHNSNLFLSGGLEGLLKLWDIRAGKAVHEYVRRLGSILDVEFMTDGKQFISSSDESRSNLSENSLIVWDVSREIPISNQVYTEAYTCPCIKSHPYEPFFVAQSNGNYIAIFSTKHPFKLDKYKRYESHAVHGFPIKCNFSSDGEVLASGSSDGAIYLYNVRSSNLIKKIKVYDQSCIDVAFHPIIPNVIACCSWSGNVSVIE